MASGTGLSRHHRAPLSRERVLLEAVALADEAGLGSLTMRRLADRLHVEPMSLYYHVAGKDEIFDGMVDLVFAEVELPPAGAEWKTAMRDRAASARAALRRHPWAIGLMDSRLNAGPATLRHHDAVIGCLRRAGFSIELAAHAISAIDSYLYGFARQELSLPFSSPEETAEMAVTFLEQFPAEAFEYLSRRKIEEALRSPRASHGVRIFMRDRSGGSACDVRGLRECHAVGAHYLEAHGAPDLDGRTGLAQRWVDVR